MRSVKNVAFQALRGGQEFRGFRRWYRLILQRRDDVVDEAIPFAHGDAEAVVRGLHVAAHVGHGSTECGAQEIDEQLTISLEAVLTFALPVHAQLRIVEQPWQQIIDDRRDRIVAAESFV